MSGYLSLDDVKNVPRLEEDFPWLTVADFQHWRTYAREQAVKANVPKDQRAEVATSIDQVTDGGVLADRALTRLKEKLTGLLSPLELAEAGEIGRTVRIQALTSEEWQQVKAADKTETQNSDWIVVAYGLHTPSLRADEDLGTAVEIVQQWPQYYVSVLAVRIVALTLNPASAKKSVAADSFASFFDGTGSPPRPAATPTLTLASVTG